MKKKEIGFSLIEVVMALAILGIAILPILSMYPSALKMTTDATRNEEWSRVSMTIVDYVKSRGYEGIDTIMAGDSKEFIYATNTDRFEYKDGAYTSKKFQDDFLEGKEIFVINTKGIKLEDYKFTVYLEKVKEPYEKLDLRKNQMLTSSAISTNSSIIYGIVKIRKNGESFDGETIRDAKFIITPIEKLGN